MMITDGATTTRPPASLRSLPSPTDVVFPGCYPWTPIPTKTITDALRLDRGLWGTWRNRGIGPAELPGEWFRPATGGRCYYLASDVLAWLGDRRGEAFDPLDAWATALRTDLGTETATEAETRRWVRIYAEAAGPRLPGGVEFTRSGFAAYLNSLVNEGLVF